MDVAICKGLLKQRLQSAAPPDRLVIMVGGNAVEQELVYWEDFDPKLFSVPPTQRFVSNRRWDNAAELQQAALDLIESGSRGVLVFVASPRDVEHVNKALRSAVVFRANRPCPIEIAVLNGLTDRTTQMAALAPPADGAAKILIGTDLDVVSSLAWADAGVSSGVRKQQNVIRRSGALAWRDVPLTLAELRRQQDRINLVSGNQFVVCGSTDPLMFEMTPTPEIDRLPLTQLILHCASFEIDPLALEFPPQPDPVSLLDAETQLRRLGFIDVDYALTDDGVRAQSLPVGLETAALLCHASRIGVLPDALILAAVTESGGIKLDPREPHHLSTASDWLDAAAAFTVAYLSEETNRAKQLAELNAANVNGRQFRVAADILKLLERELNTQARCQVYVNDGTGHNQPLVDALRQCLLAAGINQLGTLARVNGKAIVSLFKDGQNLHTLDRGVVIPKPTGEVPTPITASIRHVTPRGDKAAFTVAEGITTYRREDFDAFNHTRPGTFTFETTSRGEDIAAFGVVFLSQPAPGNPELPKETPVREHRKAHYNKEWKAAAQPVKAAVATEKPAPAKPQPRRTPHHTSSVGPASRASLLELANRFNSARA
jgi:hypothetical protein